MAHTVQLGLDTFGDITRDEDGELVSHARTIRKIGRAHV